MPNIPCPISTPCVNPANPVTNYSSADPDAEVFLGFGSATPAPDAGQPFTNPFGYFYCASLTSQDAADLCGYNGGIDNGVNGGGTSDGGLPNTGGDPGNHGGATLYWNSTQQGTATCPDGSVFTYTLPANSVRSTNPILVDRIAASIAQGRANRFLICISSISGACLGEEYDQIITATSQSPTIDWQLRSGMLPPGLDFQFDLFDSKKISIFGTPTTAGNYVFTLRATDASGNFMDKTFTLAVLGITNSPTQATVGTAYSFQFTAAGGTAPYIFSVPPGNLPSGLSMNASGLITGTPTDTTPTTFTVTIDDDAGNQCGTQFTMTPQNGDTCASIIAALSWAATGVAVPQTGANPSITVIANGFQAPVNGDLIASITNTAGAIINVTIVGKSSGTQNNVTAGANMNALYDGVSFGNINHSGVDTWVDEVFAISTFPIPVGETHQIQFYGHGGVFAGGASQNFTVQLVITCT